MRDREGPSRERSFSIAPSYRSADREVERRPEPAPQEVVRDKFAEATDALNSAVGDGLRALEAAQPTAGDRRRPIDCRRAYEEARAGIDSALSRAEKAKQLALELGQQHGLDTAAQVTAYHKQLKDATKQIDQAPKPPPCFPRVPNESDICAVMQLPPGAQRNTELAFLFSALDPSSRRTLLGRLSDKPDPEDEIAQHVARIVDARSLLLGILDGTRRIKVDPNRFQGTGRSSAGAPPSSSEEAHTASEAAHTPPPAMPAAPRADHQEGTPAASVPMPTAPPMMSVAAYGDVQGSRAPLLAVQRKASGGGASTPVASPELVAQRGFSGAGEPLPFREHIQTRFGHHDVSDVRTYQGAAAKASADQLGASAYTSGRQIAFGQAPDLRTASHEAAHAVQQRFSVQLMGGIDGGTGDPYEQHAEQIAEAVVAGRSAEALLDSMPGGAGGTSAGVQRSPKSSAAIGHDDATHDETGPADLGSHAESVPARGSYLVEQAGGSYRFVFNTTDRNQWSAPVLTGLRYYMHQVFPGTGDPVIRAVFGALKIRLEGNGAAVLPPDRRYELTVDPRIHESVLAWMSSHHPELAPHAPKLGASVLRSVDAGGTKADVGAHPAQSSTPAHDGPAHTESLAADTAHAHARPGATHAHEGIKDGSLHGEPDSDAHGWHRWPPKGELRLQPAQPTYVAGSTINAELAWDLSVHPDAGQVLLPHHCTYAWTVHRGGKLVDSDSRSVLADARRADLRLGAEPGMYEITVTASSPHFKAARQRFSSKVVVRAVSEQAFDRAAFDASQTAGPDTAFARDTQGALHLRPGQAARTTRDEIGNLDLTRGGIDALAAQGKITGDDHDVATGQLDKQRATMLEIQAHLAGGTPYVVRGTFVSREDSSTTPLQLMMHVLRRGEADGVASYELVLHDTTFGDAARHPGSSSGRLAHGEPKAFYGMLEDQALAQMAEHLHAHNDYPKGTVHLAAQRLAGDSVWERTLDTDNGRKTAKKILGTAGLIGGAALLIVPGGSVVSAGLMVVTSGAGIASVGLELEGRLAQGQLKLDRRLVMDVLQVAAVALPFGTLTKTFAAARGVGKTGFLLCMTGLDVAQGFVIAADVKQQLSVIDASTAVQLASAANDDQRKAIYAERDRRVAEVLGGAVVNGAFLLVSLGGGIKQAVAVTRHGVTFSVREPVRDLAQQGREPVEQALSTGTFEHEGQRLQLTAEERRFFEHELATHEASQNQELGATNTDLLQQGKASEKEASDAKVEPGTTSPEHQNSASPEGHQHTIHSDGRPTGRALPEYAIATSTIEAVETEAPGIFDVEFTSRTHEGITIRLGHGYVPLGADGAPFSHSEFSLSNYAHFRGVEHKAQLYSNVSATKGDGPPHGVGARISLTKHLLQRFIQRYKARFGEEPEALGGVLAFENKKNFQIAFIRSRRKGMEEKDAALAAASEISYGRHRIELGYSKLEVDIGRRATWKEIDLGDGLGKQEVPTLIEIIGRKP